jgi:DNA invertase Pin-like site-specific DNA recombinase
LQRINHLQCGGVVAKQLSDSRHSVFTFLALVIVTKLGRLGRSTRELLDLIHHIAVILCSIHHHHKGRLLVTMLAAIAKFERELIRERTGEGRKRAMANGVVFSRKPKLSDFQRNEAIKRRGNGETLSAIAKTYGVSFSLVSRL